jgi:hypothetical protein
VIKADARFSIPGGVPHRRQAEQALRRNVDEVDTPMPRLEASEILVSDISRDQLRILRKVKSEPWCHSDDAVTASHRLVAWVIGGMDDQEATVSGELFVE